MLVVFNELPCSEEKVMYLARDRKTWLKFDDPGERHVEGGCYIAKDDKQAFLWRKDPKPKG